MSIYHKISAVALVGCVLSTFVFMPLANAWDIQDWQKHSFTAFGIFATVAMVSSVIPLFTDD